MRSCCKLVLVGAFSVIVQLRRLIVYSTTHNKVNFHVCRHMTLTDTLERLLLVTDVNKTTTVDPAYIEFATQESSFLAMVKKRVE